MGTANDVLKAYRKLDTAEKQAFDKSYQAESRVCEYGYHHTPNQTTIDAMNETEFQRVGSFRELLGSVRAEH